MGETEGGAGIEMLEGGIGISVRGAGGVIGMAEAVLIGMQRLLVQPGSG